MGPYSTWETNYTTIDLWSRVHCWDQTHGVWPHTPHNHLDLSYSTTGRKVWWCHCWPFLRSPEIYCCKIIEIHFSVPQIEYPLGGSSQKGSHVYFLLYVFWVVLLFDINVDLKLPWWCDVAIVQSDVTTVVPWQLSTGSKHDYIFCYCPLVGILFQVLRID